MSYNIYDRVDCSTIALPDGEGIWYYSFEELQKHLNNICKGHILKKVYVDLISYIESLSHNKNYYSFSYLGGPVMLIFDNVAVEIHTYGEGMIQCREMNPWDMKIRRKKDFLLADLDNLNEECYYDLGSEFELTLEGQLVTSVIVDKINCYHFPMKGFDEKIAQAAEKSNSLPNHIHFRLNNGVDFGIYAEEMEYFYIELKDLYNEGTSIS